ncbi:MAG: hypothetical protein AAGC93_12920 [Cyanobacteria bacterium P01_F01_bin.53]
MLLKKLIKTLVMVILLGFYGLAFVFLFADSLPTLWILFILLCHVYYSVALILLYAYIKVREQKTWCLVLLPLLTTTSVLGIVLWNVLRPEKRVRAWLVRRS